MIKYHMSCGCVVTDEKTARLNKKADKVKYGISHNRRICAACLEKGIIGVVVSRSHTCYDCGCVKTMGEKGRVGMCPCKTYAHLTEVGIDPSRWGCKYRDLVCLPEAVKKNLSGTPCAGCKRYEPEEQMIDVYAATGCGWDNMMHSSEYANLRER